MPLLSGRPSCWPDCRLPVKLFMLKLPGRNEKRREERFSLGRSDGFLLKPKLGRRPLSVDCRGCASSLLFGMALRMLTGGYLRSFFSFVAPASCCCCCEARRDALLPKIRSPRLPRVLERLWPRVPDCWSCCWKCARFCWLPGRLAFGVCSACNGEEIM